MERGRVVADVAGRIAVGLDLYIRCAGGLAEILELKILGDPYTTSYAFSGSEQIAHYMENKNVRFGFLVIFDARARDFGTGLKPIEIVGNCTVNVLFVDVRPDVRPSDDDEGITVFSRLGEDPPVPPAFENPTPTEPGTTSEQPSPPAPPAIEIPAPAGPGSKSEQPSAAAPGHRRTQRRTTWPVAMGCNGSGAKADWGIGARTGEAMRRSCSKSHTFLNHSRRTPGQ
jgi:hypothetical protein